MADATTDDAAAAASGPTEGALRESERKLREAQRLAQVGSWEWDEASDTTTWSEELYHLNQLDPSLPPPSFEELARYYTPESFARLGAAVARTRETGVPFEEELETIRPDGVRCWRVARGEVERDASGRVVRFRGTSQDVTEHKKARDALRESEEKYRLLVDSLNVGVFLTSLDGRLLHANQWTARAAGYATVEEFLQVPAQSLYARPEDRARFVERLARDGQVRSFETTSVRQDASVYPVSLSAVLLRNAAGAPDRILGILEDITLRTRAEEERRNLQAQLAQAQKMEAVGQLAGGVAHDFNNILLAMILQLDLLRRSPTVPPEELRAAVDDLLASANRAASLTRQLLLFSRRQVMKIARHDLGAVVFELSRMLSRLLGEGVRLEVERSAEPLWFDGDSGMIEQVVTNLCVNARDAMPAGGSLTLATAAVRFDARQAEAAASRRAGRFVVLRVTDTGCGMEPSVLAHAFEPFFTTKSPGRGTGLGLATVHGIAAKHGGWVEVESAVGQGTTFRVYLPEADRAAAVGPAPEAPVAHGGAESILVVEDDAAVRRMAVACLRGLGYRVVESHSGPDALAAWEREGGRFDLVFTDMVMPEGLSGLDLCQLLRRRRAVLPAIVASGYSTEMSDDGAGTAGGVTFLSKPYDLNTLATAIRACLDGAK